MLERMEWDQHFGGGGGVLYLPLCSNQQINAEGRGGVPPPFSAIQHVAFGIDNRAAMGKVHFLGLSCHGCVH